MKVFIILLVLYSVVCLLLYFFQERMIFFPEKLDRNYQFSFQRCEEVYMSTKDRKTLHGLLFKADLSRGLIFYLHGNAGSVDSWGEVAKTYTDLGYDVFIMDYRGFGKSEGSLSGQEQFFEDVQVVYNEMKNRYEEDDIIVLGYSIGTGPAAKIASANQPKLLILQAPYYSLTDMMKHTYPIIPTFILKYKFETHEYLKRCKMPVVIFHGKQDEVIYFGSCIKLKKLLKAADQLIILDNQGHNGITDNPEYKKEMQKILQG